MKYIKDTPNTQEHIAKVMMFLFFSIIKQACSPPFQIT